MNSAEKKETKVRLQPASLQRQTTRLMVYGQCRVMPFIHVPTHR